MRSTCVMRLAILCAMLAACGGDDAAAVDAGPDAPGDIAAQLAALPGVTVTEMPPANAPPGYRYFVLQVTQPVDHDAPGATFQQEVSLIHIDAAAPMVAATSGYADFIGDFPSEPTALLHANQISIEHRFFGSSRPADPADYGKLTVAQMAKDEHAIVELLKVIYHGPWITTGASKGGMTAVYHRRFFPDDVVGTVAYVAPLSFAIPDDRYQTNIATVGTPACRTAVQAAAKEMLQNRRAALLAIAQQQATAQHDVYTRIAIGPALESAILDLEWTFWQYYGIRFCSSVPLPTATDNDLYNFLDQVSPVAFSNDQETAEFDSYFYQAYAQLGSPGLASVRGDSLPPGLASLRAFGEADFAGTFPPGVAIPTHDPATMQDIDDFVQTQGKSFVFVYGEWDPWSGGKFRVGNATDSLELIVAQGTHGSGLGDLAAADKTAAFAKLQAWTGVTPMEAQKPAHTKMLRRLQPQLAGHSWSPR